MNGSAESIGTRGREGPGLGDKEIGDAKLVGCTRKQD